MPHCSNCGRKMRVAETYCEQCGVPISGGQDPTPQQAGRARSPQPGQPQPEQEQGGQQRPPQPVQPRPERDGRDGPIQNEQPPWGGDEQADGKDTFSRRAYLFGGAGTVAAAGAGGWFLFFRGADGPTGAKAVVENYVTAIGDNDWERAGALFHEEAPPRQEIGADSSVEDYRGLLEERYRDLAVLRELDPTIARHKVWRHYPEYDEQAAGALRLRGSPKPEIVDEIKEISTLVEVDKAALYTGERGQYIAGDTVKGSFLFTVVHDGTDWALWSVFHPSPR